VVWALLRGVERLDVSTREAWWDWRRLVLVLSVCWCFFVAARSDAVNRQSLYACLPYACEFRSRVRACLLRAMYLRAESTSYAHAHASMRVCAHTYNHRACVTGT